MGYYTPYLKITVKVLADISGRHQETIRRHIKSGKLDPYSFKAIRAWLDEVGKVEEEDIELSSMETEPEKTTKGES